MDILGAKNRVLQISPRNKAAVFLKTYPNIVDSVSVIHGDQLPK
jgi:hypothetical protein